MPTVPDASKPVRNWLRHVHQPGMTADPNQKLVRCTCFPTAEIGDRQVNSVAFSPAAKSLTFSGLMENPLVVKKKSPNIQAKCTKEKDSDIK